MASQETGTAVGLLDGNVGGRRVLLKCTADGWDALTGVRRYHVDQGSPEYFGGVEPLPKEYGSHSLETLHC